MGLKCKTILYKIFCVESYFEQAKEFQVGILFF